MTYHLAIGQVWRSLVSGRTYRILAIDDPLGVKVEQLACVFPHPSAVFLPAAMFSPPAMVPEEVAVAEDFDAYLNRLADREGY
jgi:hypothetical protein